MEEQGEFVNVVAKGVARMVETESCLRLRYVLMLVSLGSCKYIEVRHMGEQEEEVP